MKFRMSLVASAAVLVVAAAGHAHAQSSESATKPPAAAAKQQAPTAGTESQKQAQAILTRMAEFLAGTPRFCVSLRAGYDEVQKSGQKIEFGESRSGVPYYKCGATWYAAGYANSGVVYVPVPPPQGY